MKRIFLTSVFLIAISLSPIFGQWEKTNGPRNYRVKEMALLDDFQVLLSDEKVFGRETGTPAWSAATGLPADFEARYLYQLESTVLVKNNASQVYRTFDGTAWEPITYPDTNVFIANIFPFDSFVLLSGLLKNSSPYRYLLFYSSDNGTTWLDVTPSAEMYSVRKIAKEGNGYRLYFEKQPSTSWQQMYHSTDGTNWVFIGQSANLPDVLFSGRKFDFSSPGGQFRFSDNDGQAWSPLQPSLAPYGGLTGVFTNNSALFVCHLNQSTTRNLEIFRTYDGANWVLLPNVPPLYSGLFFDGDILYAIGDFNQVYSSSDNGDTWTADGLGLPSDFELEGMVFSPDKIAVYGIGGIYAKPDGLTIWTNDHDGLPLLDFYASDMATQSGALIAAGQGIFQTTDHGDNWKKVNNGIARLKTITYNHEQIVAKNDHLTVGGSGYLYHSFDGGSTWEQTPSDPQWRDEHGSFCMLTGSNDTLFACKKDSVVYHIYRSYDGGDTWDFASDVPGASSSFWTTAAGLLYANGKLLSGKIDAGLIFTSFDQGVTWPESYYIGEFGSIEALAYADSYYYAGGFGTNPPNKKILRSTDGYTWEKIIFDHTPGQFEIRDILAKDSLVVVATRYSGVFLSRDYGGNWTNITQNEPSIAPALSLEMDDAYLYIGTEMGVWRRPLADFGITATHDVTTSVPSFKVSPNPAGAFLQIEILSENWMPEPAILSVFDLSGKCVLERLFQNGDKLETAGLPTGIYFIRIVQGGVFLNGKFVKK